MTDPDLPAVAPGLDITSTRTEAGALTPFKVDGELYYAKRPKGGQLMALARGMQDADNMTEIEQVQILDSFLDLCLDADTAAALRDRMEDPEDNFDVDDLIPLIDALQAVWGKGPAARPRSSSSRRRTTGRASTARARSTG